MYQLSLCNAVKKIYNYNILHVLHLQKYMHVLFLYRGTYKPVNLYINEKKQEEIHAPVVMLICVFLNFVHISQNSQISVNCQKYSCHAMFMPTLHACYRYQGYIYIYSSRSGTDHECYFLYKSPMVSHHLLKLILYIAIDCLNRCNGWISRYTWRYTNATIVHLLIYN